MGRNTPDDSAETQRNGRRTFLTQVAAAGAALGTAVNTIPAIAQETSERTSPPANAKNQTDVAVTLARYAINLKYEDLPADVIRTAKRTLLDSVGCAIGAYGAGPVRIALKMADDVSAKKPASVFCSGTKTSVDLAVFANGLMIRYLDFSDGYISAGSGHPSDTIAPVLAAAEIAGSSGRDLILGTVLSYEIFCKIMDVFPLYDLGIDSATIAALAGGIAAGRLMGLNEKQLVQAIGIIVGSDNAINQGRVGTLSNWKAYGSANACHIAIFAVQLAKAGMTGPEQVFEGRDGFFRVMARKPFTLPSLGGGNTQFGILHAFTKRFPLGQYAQTVAQAAVQSRQYFKDPSEIQEVVLKVSRTAIKVMADTPDKWHPQTHETADHSMPYSAGLALVYGNIDADYYEDPYLHDAKILDVVNKIKCVPSDEADRVKEQFNLCELELVLKSGQRKTERVEYHRGHWKNPMTDAEMEEKFRVLARKHMPAPRVDNLLKQLWALESVPKVGSLLELTKLA